MSGQLSAEGYFVITPEWVLDADISDKAYRLYGVLRSYADHRTLVAFPSRRTLADRLHVADVKVVDRAMAELEEVGAVAVQRGSNRTGESRTSNRYLLRHTRPQTPEGLPDHTPSAVGAQTASSTPSGPGTPGVAEPYPRGPGAPAPWGPGAPAPWGPGAPLTRPIRTRGTPTESLPAAPLALVPDPADRFDEFWAAYPKKVSKADARRAWIKVTRRVDPDRLIAAVKGYPFDLSRIQYVPYPATWLNGGRWDDDPAAVRPRRDTSGYGPSLRPSARPEDYYDAGWHPASLEPPDERL